jgi:tRNA threonylcarbamoyladenosine biosynthesis protein TsaE
VTTFSCITVEETHALGLQLANHLTPGDVVILDGPLGAGKTTFTQGIAAGLDVRGPITSPTFVIYRIHPNNGAGPALIHLDAYRLNSLAEVDDLDLDSNLYNAVLVAEWGSGKLENIADEYLVVEFTRNDDDSRRITFIPNGNRWDDLLNSGIA